MKTAVRSFYGRKYTLEPVRREMTVRVMSKAGVEMKNAFDAARRVVEAGNRCNDD